MSAPSSKHPISGSARPSAAGNIASTGSTLVQTINAFEQQLLQWQATLNAPLSPNSALVQSVRALQISFRDTLLPLALPQQTPIVTEMNRHLRLLAVDVTFLQAARQATTRQQRTEQIQSRLQQLPGFTQALQASVTAAGDESSDGLNR